MERGPLPTALKLAVCPPAQLALVVELYWVWVAICAIKGTESLLSSGDC